MSSFHSLNYSIEIFFGIEIILQVNFLKFSQIVFKLTDLFLIGQFNFFFFLQHLYCNYLSHVVKNTLAGHLFVVFFPANNNSQTGITLKICFICAYSLSSFSVVISNVQSSSYHRLLNETQISIHTIIELKHPCMFKLLINLGCIISV